MTNGFVQKKHMNLTISTRFMIPSLMAQYILKLSFNTYMKRTFVKTQLIRKLQTHKHWYEEKKRSVSCIPEPRHIVQGNCYKLFLQAEKREQNQKSTNKENANHSVQQIVDQNKVFGYKNKTRLVILSQLLPGNQLVGKEVAAVQVAAPTVHQLPTFVFYYAPGRVD